MDSVQRGNTGDNNHYIFNDHIIHQHKHYHYDRSDYALYQYLHDHQHHHDRGQPHNDYEYLYDINNGTVHHHDPIDHDHQPGGGQQPDVADDRS